MLRLGRRAFLGAAAALAALLGTRWLIRDDGAPQEQSAPAAAPQEQSGPAADADPTVDNQEPGKSADAPEPAPSVGEPAPSVGEPLEPDSGSSQTAPEASAPPEAAAMPQIPADAASPGVIAVGAAYLRTRPDEADPTVLMTALSGADPDVLAAARRDVAADFASGRTVELDGWVLSQSEARVAALVALVCGEEC